MVYNLGGLGGGSPRAPIAPSGPDQGAIALSLLLLIKLEGGILSKTGGEVGPVLLLGIIIA